MDFEANPNVTRKHMHSKKRKIRSLHPHNKRLRNGGVRLARKKTNKSKKRKKSKSKKKSNKKHNPIMSPLNENKNKKNQTKSKDGLPIITEEDNEDGAFSDSYIPTRYHASGFFSYHTWDKNDKSDTVRPPDEDRIVRSGPSIWHWSWDLSFGLYDDIYDKLNKNHSKHKTHKNNDFFLEDTWLNLEGPIASWQPLFAAIIWFIISMNILFPLSMISQATPCPDTYNNGNAHNTRVIHITSLYSHFQAGLILFSFEISSWITTPISSFLILRLGPSCMLFVGILLMILSSVAMSRSDGFYNLQFVIYLIVCRMCSGIGFNIVRQSSLFLWSCFAKLDMLSSGLGFCVGPVFGDLLFVYLGFNFAYIIYALILFVLLLIPLLIIIIFKLLSLQQISQLEIPPHIKNIRKPRFDIEHAQFERSNCKNILLLAFKLEILCVTIIGLTALEPTLPIYALNPSLEITVSGALFTFIYLPLLALSSLIGLIYAKSSSKFLNSAKKHVKFRRRGMKYITKTLSINFSGINQTHAQNENCIQLKQQQQQQQKQKDRVIASRRFNVSKSEKIKLVEKPSWLVKKKKLLPSPDVSQHHVVVLLGLALNCVGFQILSGTDLWFITNSNGIDLILGLVLISCGSSFIIISCIDSFINGLLLNTRNINQTELTYICINLSILMGPLFGGLMLDLANNNFITLAQYWSFVQSIHFSIYFFFFVVGYFIKCIRHFVIKRIQQCRMRKEKEKHRQQQQQQQQAVLRVNPSLQQALIAPIQNSLIRDLSCGKIQKSMHTNTTPVLQANNNQNKIEKNINIAMINDVNVNQLKQRIKPKNSNTNKEDDSDSNRAYIYGTDLRHLCWWKRGLNVRFPYIQWMESGWSATHLMKNGKNPNCSDSEL